MPYVHEPTTQARWRARLSARPRFAIGAALAALGCGAEVDDHGFRPGATEDVSHVAAQLTVPSGFKQINSWTGAKVYRKDWAGGSPDFVTVVDLRSATLRSLTGSGSGPCATISRKLAGPGSGSFWADATSQNTSSLKARVILNGAFFSTNSTPTGIAFGLKTAGVVRSYGYGCVGPCGTKWEQTASNTLLFGFNMGKKSAWIGAYSKAQMDNATPDYVGALGPLCCKSPASYTDRTFVGIRDDNGDGTYETVMFFSSDYARQSGTDGADDTLKKFGATVRAMLDGGGSTALVVDGKKMVTNSRTIPHALAVFSP